MSKSCSFYSMQLRLTKITWQREVFSRQRLILYRGQIINLFFFFFKPSVKDQFSYPVCSMIHLSHNSFRLGLMLFLQSGFAYCQNYFTAATKRVISSIQSFTKKISKRKGKDSGEIVLYPVNIDEHCS